MEKFPLTFNGHNGSHQYTRALDLILEEARISGQLNLSGRNLKEFPNIPVNYDLSDTVSADLSKNKLNELPTQICEFFLLEVLNCYHNVIRCLPDTVIALQSLTFINLSHNQLCTIPASLCQLPLQVLIISDNRLVSLPEEICHMDQLMELDVACNQIAILPPKIGDLESLRSLNLRKNLLTKLPIEVCDLRLVKLDISGNRITFLPTLLRQMTSLLQLVVDRNPMISPPAVMCMRGQAHIFKYLELQAIRDSKKQGVLVELDYHQNFRKADVLGELQIQNSLSKDRKKRQTLDSGYSTSYGGDCCWLQDPHDPIGETEMSYKLSLQTAQPAKEQRKERYCYQVSLSSDKSNTTSSITQNETPDLNHSIICQNQVPKLISGCSADYDEGKFEDTEVLRKQENILNKVQKSGWDSLNLFSSATNSNTSKVKRSAHSSNLHLQTYKEYKEKLRLQRAQNNIGVYRSPFVCNNTRNCDPPNEEILSVVSSMSSSQTPEENTTTSNHVRCEASDSGNVLQESVVKVDLSELASHINLEDHLENIPGKLETRSQKCCGKIEKTSENKINQIETTVKENSTKVENSLESDSVKTVNFLPKDSVKVLHMSVVGSEEHEEEVNESGTWREKDCDYEALENDVHSNHMNSFTTNQNRSNDCNTQARYKKIFINQHFEFTMNGQKRSSDFKKLSSSFTEPVNSNFTIRRRLNKAKEEQEHIDHLRKIIKNNLKVVLPDDLGGALRDGVLLCQLMNKLHPNFLVNIHVPSAAVPQLSVAKSRWNVENFLKSCEKKGVPKDRLCSIQDILEEKGLVQVAVTVQEIARSSKDTYEHAECSLKDVSSNN
ncbi:leucine-rich repeat and calponin homology domain-containing protein 3-like isoform X2 [Limulus polyphemus]|uniref:Leucine-rich repeat and calponin homology domain-containing protein 3-like isoform X2 n=1 Tax=Limulus polyphemus TaxID=6850 RepID=A0ABM1SF30_LIMPO|nr:leucine-rich repeat and calponin homology domain-containing protein 3-like isoform X2 [Limulus polyphemus]